MASNTNSPSPPPRRRRRGRLNRRAENARFYEHEVCPQYRQHVMKAQEGSADYREDFDKNVHPIPFGAAPGNTFLELYKWDPTTEKYVRRKGRTYIPDYRPIQGPPNWDQIWPNYDEIDGTPDSASKTDIRPPRPRRGQLNKKAQKSDFWSGGVDPQIQNQGLKYKNPQLRPIQARTTYNEIGPNQISSSMASNRSGGGGRPRQRQLSRRVQKAEFWPHVVDPQYRDHVMKEQQGLANYRDDFDENVHPIPYGMAPGNRFSDLYKYDDTTQQYKRKKGRPKKPEWRPIQGPANWNQLYSTDDDQEYLQTDPTYSSSGLSRAPDGQSHELP